MGEQGINRNLVSSGVNTLLREKHNARDVPGLAPMPSYVIDK